MGKKQEILEKLLKAQREGKLNNHHVIAKIEALPAHLFEEPLNKAVDPKLDQQARSRYISELVGAGHGEKAELDRLETPDLRDYHMEKFPDKRKYVRTGGAKGTGTETRVYERVFGGKKVSKAEKQGREYDFGAGKFSVEHHDIPHEFYVVTHPTKDSVMEDVKFKANHLSLGRHFKGGLKPEEIHSIHGTEESATKVAQKLLDQRIKKSDRAASPKDIVAGLKDNLKPEHHGSPKELVGVVQNVMTHFKGFGDASKEKYESDDSYRSSVEHAAVKHFYPKQYESWAGIKKSTPDDEDYDPQENFNPKHTGRTKTHTYVAHQSYHATHPYEMEHGDVETDIESAAKFAAEHTSKGHTVHTHTDEHGALHVSAWKPKGSFLREQRQKEPKLGVQRKPKGWK